MTGYTRQALANIADGLTIFAADVNAEFNQLLAAFNGTSGHVHDGNTGNGPKLGLGTSVTGFLPIVNGGTGGLNNLTATTDPVATSDINSSYAVGSTWINTTSDTFFVCVDNTVNTAIWKKFQPYSTDLFAIAGLTSAADKMVYSTGAGTWANTTLSAYARSYLSNADAVTTRGTLGLTIGTNVQAWDADLDALAGLASAADRLPYFTGSATAALATFTTAGRNLVAGATTGAQLTTLGVSAYAQTLLPAADAATARGILGVDVSGTSQPLNSNLTALSSFNTNGILVQTAANTFTGRTLTGTAAEITVTNGAGTAGNPTLSLPAALTFTGKTITGGTYASASYSGTWTSGAITTSSATITGGSITGLSSAIPVASGGTGAATLTGIVKGTGTTAMVAATQGTDFYQPGGTDVAVADGGTNISSYTTGDLLYASGATTLTKLAKGTAGQVLQMNAGATAPQWVTLPISKQFESAAQTITSGGSLTLAHSLGVQPKLYNAYLVCISADMGYTVGDEVIINHNIQSDGNFSKGIVMVPDVTNMNIRFGSNNPSFSILNKGSGSIGNISSNTNWNLIIRAWA